jgi:hypothetical protein
MSKNTMGRSPTEIAREYGLSLELVRYRQKAGWPEARWYSPAHLPSLRSRAQKAGISPNIVYARRAAGWPEHDWFSPVLSRADASKRARAAKSETSASQKCNSLIAGLALENGLSPDLAIYRVRSRGMRVRIACSIPPMSHIDRAKLSHANRPKGTLAERARQYGLSKVTVYGRKARGWPEALWLSPALSRSECGKRARAVQLQK